MAIWQKYPKFQTIIGLLLILASCQKRAYDVDLSEVSYEPNIVRFDQKLFSIDPSKIQEEVSMLYQDHPKASELFFEHILRGGRYPNLNYAQIARILQDPYMKELSQDTDSAFSKIDEVEDGLDNLFSHVLYYYPEDSIPGLYAMLTAFTYSVVTYEDIEAISLDMFLGEGYKYYPSKDFPRYLMKRMRSEYIIPQVAKTYFSNKFPEEEYTEQVMLSKMIYYGKQLFFMDVMLPELDDSLKVEYTGAQLVWCKDQEDRIYQHFVDQGLFYETNQEKVRPYLTDGPFTVADGVPNESAPRMGEWVGWQIVSNYMENNPKVTPQELFEERNYQKIFKQSKYKP